MASPGTTTSSTVIAGVGSELGVRWAGPGRASTSDAAPWAASDTSAQRWNHELTAL